ncbi:hypothetical protein CGLO_07142 [Colletotrichum gloeosporioides Cg-14]|uniref:Uncharacterized protein n=1 Tax=Colletotrichum gloeosporioides (strain Cg-14) TaxID=1237896 RepID=T0KK21_COLGC|nr:hypothetical protein CGLO_07142 [Colletotrichum gloeosporioides Cg-14]
MPSQKDHGGSDEKEGYGNDGDTLPSLTSTVKQAKKKVEAEVSKVQEEASKAKERLVGQGQDQPDQKA